MPRRPTSNTEQIALRVPREWLDQAEEIAQSLGRPGITPTRADALRAALATGLEVLLRESRRKKR